MDAKRIVIGLQGILAVLILLSSSSFGATKCVNPGGTGGCYSSIQTAINAVANGDTVEVSPGIYKQNVTIGKPINLLAKGIENTIIMPDTGNSVIFVSGSSGAKMAGFKIESSGGNGVYSNATVDVRVENCIIQNCSQTGILFVNSGSSLLSSNNVIYNNSGDGVSLATGVHYLYGNIVLNNHAAGFHESGETAVTNEYNCLYGNAPNYLGSEFTVPGTGEIIQDPQFVDPIGGDFHLGTGSPCINTGPPGMSYFDCDGTRNDMGVYGGPSAYCGPGPVVTELQLVPATVVKGETFNIQAKGATR